MKHLSLLLLSALGFFLVTTMLLCYPQLNRLFPNHTVVKSSLLPSTSAPSTTHHHFHHLHQPLVTTQNSTAPLRTSLTTLPRIIHQTWKTTTLPQWALYTVDSWKMLNPAFEHWLWDDASMEDFMRTEYAALWPIYSVHLRPVQKADLFRYAVVHKYGGVYADIDVVCVVPIHQWTAFVPGIDDANVDMMMVGWEALVSAKEVAKKHFAVEHQLCQWTFAAVPHHWMLANVLKDIQQYYTSGRHEKDISIIKSTGPGMFSISIQKSIAQRFNNVTFGSKAFGRQKEQMKTTVTRIGGLYILPLEAFGSRGQHDLHAVQQPQQLVVHNFQGSWKEEYKVRKQKLKKEKEKKEKGKRRKRRGRLRV